MLFDFDDKDYLEKIQKMPEWLQETLLGSITFKEKQESVEEIAEDDPMGGSFLTTFVRAFRC